MVIPFLLLGFICISLIFLIQKGSRLQLAHAQAHLASLEEKNQELFEQINAQKTRAFQESQEMQRLLSHLEHELEETRLRFCHFEQEMSRDKQLIEMRASLIQLKKQFEEKSAILHQTRKELFAVQGELFSLQREKEEQEYALSSEIQIHIQPSEEESLEREVLLLEQLVSSLLSQKPKAIKRKKISEEDFFLAKSGQWPIYP